MTHAVLATPVRASRAVRLRAPLLTAGAVAAGTLALHLRDPHEPGSWGFCPYYAATGLYCPGCGALRAVNDLTNLDVTGAASSNLLFVASIPLVLYFWVRWTQRAWAGTAPAREGHPRLAIAALVVLMVVFAVLRNLPVGSWLAP